MKKRARSYKDYQNDAENHNASIMKKYGAPEGAKPPQEKSFMPASSDRHYRRYAFTKKTRLEAWGPSNRNYPPHGTP